jgi:hypothetical protein
MSSARKEHNTKVPSLKTPSAAISGSTLQSAAPTQVLWLPFTLTVILVLISFVARIQQHSVLTWSLWGAALALAAWQVVLFLQLRTVQARREPVTRALQIVLRPQHYVQAAVQLSVYVYWGYHYRPVYDHAWLILAQLVFAYAFDMLLAWSRREKYVLGFGAFPIVFSTNLFLWFKDDWFYLQFLMIAVGFMGKEFVRWQRDGKSTHIFNPSAFTLGLFSIILIATHTSDLTWGQEIASTLTLAPYIYVFLFCIGLVVMYFFSITLIAGTAAAMLFGLSSLYLAITGVPYFLDSDIPAAVFLGLHLLVTDPSTSPRSQLGKAIFGALYGIGVFALYALLNSLGAPTFYDKLLCVPLLNLSVIGIDRFVQRLQSKPIASLPRWSNPLHMAVWAVFFIAMTASGKTDGKHTGDSLPFWEQACKENRTNACARLLKLEDTYCGDNSAWACNELGTHYAEGKIVTVDTPRALEFFSKACELRFQAGCVNLLASGTPVRADPRALDLRLLLREGGKNLMAMPERELYVRACQHGFAFACRAGGPL